MLLLVVQNLAEYSPRPTFLLPFQIPAFTLLPPHLLPALGSDLSPANCTSGGCPLLLRLWIQWHRGGRLFSCNSVSSDSHLAINISSILYERLPSARLSSEAAIERTRLSRSMTDYYCQERDFPVFQIWIIVSNPARMSNLISVRSA